jgi:voltage-gated potassium channel
MTVSTLYRQQRWERRAEWPLAGVAVVFLIVFSVQILARPHGFTARLLDWIMVGLYVVFVIDYVVRLLLAEHRTRWFFWHLLDFVIIAVPFVQSLRVLRLVVLVEVMEKLFGDAFRGRIVAYTAVSAILLIYSGSLGVLAAERTNSRANIKTFGDAVWWAITTLTTVGYGDHYPITALGRVIAVLLMLGGISLIGIVAATVATWMVQSFADVDAAEQAATAGQIEQLRDQITHLTEVVAGLPGVSRRGESGSD